MLITKCAVSVLVSNVNDVIDIGSNSPEVGIVLFNVPITECVFTGNSLFAFVAQLLLLLWQF